MQKIYILFWVELLFNGNIKKVIKLRVLLSSVCVGVKF